MALHLWLLPLLTLLAMAAPAMSQVPQMATGQVAAEFSSASELSWAELQSMPLPPPVVLPPPITIPPIAASIPPHHPPEGTKSIEEIIASASEPAIVDTAVETASHIKEFPPHWYEWGYWYQPNTWKGGVELGLNGSSGTSDTLSTRSGVFGSYKDDFRKFKFDVYHNRTKSAGVETQNNAQANTRHDWLWVEHRWTLFTRSQVYFDEFQEFDVNVNLGGGVGYRFLKEEWIELMGSFGSGVSREFGGSTDRWVPEGQFGFEFEHQISGNQKFTAKMDYFPDWENFSRYRVLADLGWEVQLQVPSNTSLKFSATDRYDSDPEGVEPHNLNYSILLLWKL